MSLAGIDLMQLHQRVITFDLMHLAASHIEGQGIAFSVRAKVDFRGEAAARAAERFPILIPPFCAGGMLVRPHNRGIDGMFLVGGRPKARQCVFR